jgi:hypothetical protein
MNLPLQFPDAKEEARRRAAEFQRLSAEERWREMAALWAFGWAVVRSSPRRAAIEDRMQDQENEWRRIQEELFSRHG